MRASDSLIGIQPALPADAGGAGGYAGGMMELIAWGLLVAAVNAVWLFTVLIGLPGTWLMILTALAVAYVNWEPGAAWSAQMIHPVTLMVAAGLAFLGELAEFLLGAAGSKTSGGSLWGATGAIVGGIVGGIVGTFAIPIPLLGSLAGACAGAFSGALIAEVATGRAMTPALESGKGAALGRLYGTVAKLAVGVVIWIQLTVAVFWP